MPSQESEQKLVYTPVEDIPEIRTTLRQTFQSGKLKSVEYRRQQLSQLAYMVQDNLELFQKALASDLGRPELESNMLEITMTMTEIVNAHSNVRKWAKTEGAPWSLNFSFMRPAVRKEAKGVVLIISPFNYPILLSLVPMAGAIAAGNAVILKPSELSPASSSLMAELFAQYLDKDSFRVVNGAIPETTKLLELQWDHILYTGSGPVAKIVATAAAKHLTPVSLELGGKSPVVIDPNCDMETAARRILWGKFANAGQTCIAPDYILVPAEAQEKLVKAFADIYKEFYPEGGLKSDSFARIITPGHFSRVKTLLDDTKGTVVLGGETDASQKYIAPTIVSDVTPADSLMSQEIFGPILPILPVKSVDEAVEFINSHDHPLVIYAFSQDAAFKSRVFDNTQSGAAVANEVLLYIGVDGMPFGGVGASGYGAYTGRYSFDMFTHLRPTLDSPRWMDFILGNRYPPYTPKKLKIMNMILFPRLPAREVPAPTVSARL